MDKFKNILKSDTPAASTSGRISGQGSHFPSKEEVPITATAGSTATGTEENTRAHPDTSAAPTSSTAAAITQGPEQGGHSHIGTVSPTEATKPSTGAIDNYTVSGGDLSKSQAPISSSGTAVVGGTSTYSSSQLTQGDPVSSVINPSSSDPLTYKKPESGSEFTGAGVSTGAAAAAATLAFNSGEERKKTEMAGNENPYRTESLDPRVDGLSKASAESAATRAPATTSGSATAAPAGAGTGLASAGATSAFTSGVSRQETAAPSTLTSTVDPADRSAAYGATTHLKGGVESDVREASTVPVSQTEENQPGMVGKMLGAVGLGGVAGALGFAGTSAAAERDTSAVAETPEQPTTTTGITSYAAPTVEGTPTSHHRKESIPTTAYPSGTFDSPRAINQPIGGAGSPVVHGDSTHHTGRDVAAGTAAATAVGATAIGAHEYNESRSVQPPQAGEASIHHATTIAEPTGSSGHALPSTTSTTGAARVIPESVTEPHATSTTTTPMVPPTTAAPVAAPVAERTIEQPSAGQYSQRPEQKDHTARDATAGAAVGAAAVGAGTYGAHEYSKREAEVSETEAARDQAAREKELAKERAAHEKELEKHHKAEEKAAAKEEKEHQKELEKQEKQHQKEIEKEEKQHQKEVEKAEKQHQKVLEKEEKQHHKELEEEEKRRQKEAEEAGKRSQVGEHRDVEAAALAAKHEQELLQARQIEERQAGVGERDVEAEALAAKREQEEKHAREERERLAGIGAVGGTAGAAAGGYEHEKEVEKEKKPSLFRRIFKRRKNKETGEDEEYSSDEEVPSAEHKGPAAAYGAAIVGGGAGVYGAEHEKKAAAAAAAPAGGPNTTYDQHRDVQTSSTTTSQRPSEAITGLPYDPSKDPEAARRLSEHTHGQGIGTFDRQDATAAATTAGAAPTAAAVGAYEERTAPTTLESSGVKSAQPTAATTGTTAPLTTTHDRSAAPATVGSTGTHTAQPATAVTGLPEPSTKDLAASQHHPGGSTVEGGFNPNTNFTLGEVQESHGIGEKIKEALHIGGSHKKEGE